MLISIAPIMVLILTSVFYHEGTKTRRKKNAVFAAEAQSTRSDLFVSEFSAPSVFNRRYLHFLSVFVPSW